MKRNYIFHYHDADSSVNRCYGNSQEKSLKAKTVTEATLKFLELVGNQYQYPIYCIVLEGVFLNYDATQKLLRFEGFYE